MIGVLVGGVVGTGVGVSVGVDAGVRVGAMVDVGAKVGTAVDVGGRGVLEGLEAGLVVEDGTFAAKRAGVQLLRSISTTKHCQRRAIIEA